MEKKISNWLRAARFETPDNIPVACGINAACWHHYPKTFLWEMIEAHPTVFPWFKNAAAAERKRIEDPSFRVDSRVGQPYRDPWGCVWETTDNGIVGTVIEHPLRDWSAFANYTAPDPDKTDGMFEIDWDKIAEARRQAAAEGRHFLCGLHHGHSFLRLIDIRGYEALIFDMADGAPQLQALINMVRDFNLAFIERLLRLQPDAVSIPEDLGMQVGPMLSPAQFRTWLSPCYRDYVNLVREKSDALVHMHSDGDIRSLIAELLADGVDIINLQDLVNGLDWIEENLKGKVCIDLDIDRQSITCRGPVEAIDAFIKEEVVRLGSKQGGLMMIYGLYPGIPEANVKATLDAMEKYSYYYS